MTEPDRPHMTIWRMFIACLIPKATDSHSEYVILIAFPRQQLWCERVHCLSSSLLFFKKASFVVYGMIILVKGSQSKF